jgi:hypothetical protein
MGELLSPLRPEILFEYAPALHARAGVIYDPAFIPQYRFLTVPINVSGSRSFRVRRRYYIINCSVNRMCIGITPASRIPFVPDSYFFVPRDFA